MFERINNIITLDQEVLAGELEQPYVNWGTNLLIWFLCTFCIIIFNLFFVSPRSGLANNPVVLLILLSTSSAAILCAAHATAHALGGKGTFVKYAYMSVMLSATTMFTNFLARLLVPIPLFGAVASLVLRLYLLYLMIIGYTHVRHIYQLSALKAVMVLLASTAAGIAIFLVGFLMFSAIG